MGLFYLPVFKGMSTDCAHIGTTNPINTDIPRTATLRVEDIFVTLKIAYGRLHFGLCLKIRSSICSIKRILPRRIFQWYYRRTLTRYSLILYTVC